MLSSGNVLKAPDSDLMFSYMHGNKIGQETYKSVSWILYTGPLIIIIYLTRPHDIKNDCLHDFDQNI